MYVTYIFVLQIISCIKLQKESSYHAQRHIKTFVYFLLLLAMFFLCYMHFSLLFHIRSFIYTFIVLISASTVQYKRKSWYSVKVLYIVPQLLFINIPFFATLLNYPFQCTIPCMYILLEESYYFQKFACTVDCLFLYNVQASNTVNVVISLVFPTFLFNFILQKAMCICNRNGLTRKMCQFCV